jgi:hypothetical protein
MNDDGSGTRYKVGRVLEKYDLDHLDDSLPGLWTGADGDPRSLRDLASHINCAILGTAMEAAGMSLLEGEAENYYRLLTDETTSSGDRTQARRTLERGGVDVTAVQADFVTHQAVHTYLRKHHGAERAARETDRRETVEQFRGRLQAVTSDAIESAQRTGTNGFEEFSVVVMVEVICSECGVQLDAAEVLSGASCDCPGPS